VANTPARRGDHRDDRIGPVPAIVGGVVAALVLFWVVGLVISVVAGVIKIVVLGAVVGGALWLWSRFSRD
jgi:hypothetical protein